jgi:hypothetical protein
VTVHLDIGGEGRYPGALNVNPFGLTSTTGTPGREIPNLVVGRGEALPIADHVADLVTVESAPIRPGAAEEIARVLRPGGEVRLLHPAGYAAETHGLVAAALGAELVSSSSLQLGEDMTLTVLRRAANFLR